MGKIRAAIKGVGAYLPDYILTNDELSRMVDTSDEWIRTRTVKEWRGEHPDIHKHPAIFVFHAGGRG